LNSLFASLSGIGVVCFFVVATGKADVNGMSPIAAVASMAICE